MSGIFDILVQVLAEERLALGKRDQVVVDPAVVKAGVHSPRDSHEGRSLDLRVQSDYFHRN